MNQRAIGVTGIGTDVGKTVVSSILVQALDAAYWKPVQAGDLYYSDSDKIRGKTDVQLIFPERHRLNTPMSPHAAAKIDNVEISLSDFSIPDYSGTLIVEGAGGIMVPLNDKGDLIGDLYKHLNIPVVVVSRHYLGSINHTLLTLEYLKQKEIDVIGLIFVGEENVSTQSLIISQYSIPWVQRIPETDSLDKEFIREQAEVMKESFKKVFENK
jgi:dethiobiotin synthetase